MLTFASGGWVILLMTACCLGVAAWLVGPALFRHANRPAGDGKNIESYGFDLSNLALPRQYVVAATKYRDMVPVMWATSASKPDANEPADSPKRWHSMQARNDPQYAKYLVPSDLVIGVEINGESRAYPQSVMNVHEVVNDTLGGVPIAVTYNVPCDSIVVFDRRADGGDSDGRGSESPLIFGHSGLVYDSNLLMYDRRSAPDAASPAAAGGGESLWCQLLGEAVSGPRKGEKLRMLPASRTTWAAWSKSHPQTSVLDRDLSMTKRYADAAPTQYFNSDKLWFPVERHPGADFAQAIALKTPIMIVDVELEASGEKASGGRRAYVVEAIAKKAGAAGTWTDTINGVDVAFTVDEPSQTVIAASAKPASRLSVIHTFWFAWHALRPEDDLVR